MFVNHKIYQLKILLPSIILSIHCYKVVAVLNHRTSQCNGCLTRCLSLYPIDVLFENDRSANNIDIVFE